ncbi:hypothetical protein HPP92_027552 [Vanilla planifolia]|uniref:ADP-ribosylation factor n=1 Tax=Vanilla planifolia TaxID=51239 RepID=A0A835PCH6_VANPL|nr:hypothetical protein HPP92_027552 [Vanilla planifolia]
MWRKFNIKCDLHSLGCRWARETMPLWRHYFNNTDGLIYVVDSLDRERIGKAKAEFQKGAMTPMEVCEGLGLYDLRNRVWHIQGTCALKGDGLYEGLDWLASSLKELQAMGRRPPLALPLSDLSYRLGSLSTR